MATLPAAMRQFSRGSRSRAWRPAAGCHRLGIADRAAGLAAAVIGGCLLGCGIVLAARRLAGGFTGTDAAAWLVAGAGISLVSAVDLLAAALHGSAGPWLARWGVACGVASVAVPARPGSGWLGLAAVAMAALPLVMRPRSSPLRRPAAAAAEPVQTRGRPWPVPRPPRRSADDDRRRATQGKLVQRQERYELPSGADCLRGRVLLAVAAGGRTAHAHVGFCPAFTRTPSVQVETDYDGVEAVVAAAEVLPWGVRVECRLAEPADEPLEIPVEVFVRGDD